MDWQTSAAPAGNARLIEAGPPRSLLLRAGLIAAFALIVCARMPDVILHGRLWAEEGRVFYQDAATMPWYRALLLSYGGYLNLVANAAPIAARHLLPLEYVPWFTTGVGLMFQCCPAILLVCSRDRCLQPKWVLVAALLLIATAPLVEEVWLQTLHSQFHLALCAALILALRPPGRRLAVFGWLVLLLAPLCGPSAWLLLPLFVARAALDRSRARAMQATFLAAGTALQIAFFYVHMPGRSYGIQVPILMCIVYVKQVVVPFAGRDVASTVSNALQANIAAGRIPWPPLLTVSALLTALTVAVVRRRHRACTWLFLAAIPLGGIGYFGAIGGGPRLLIIGNGGRYSFLPEVLTALVVLLVATGPKRPDTWIARLAVGWLLIVGAIDVDAPWPTVKTGPNWSAQVAQWRRDHNHPIALWPPGWTMRLSRQ